MRADDTTRTAVAQALATLLPEEQATHDATGLPLTIVLFLGGRANAADVILSNLDANPAARSVLARWLGAGDGLRAPNDGPLDSETGEGQPIDSGGWWTPYVETPWGYFQFAVRPVEQPDGLILFWHDAEGAHSQNVVTDLPGDKLILAELQALRAASPEPGLPAEPPEPDDFDKGPGFGSFVGGAT